MSDLQKMRKLMLGQRNEKLIPLTSRTTALNRDNLEREKEN